MSEIIFFFLALLLPCFCGYLLTILLEGKTPVLRIPERIALGFLFGVILTTFLVFLLHVVFLLPINLMYVMSIEVGLTVVLSILYMIVKPAPRVQVALPEGKPFPVWISTLLYAGLSWTFLKILLLGVTFLLFIPPFFNDTLDGWNLRGRTFFATQSLTLTAAQPDGELAIIGESSYPPAVPLIKAMIALPSGTWHEGSVNAIHIFWYAAAVTLVYCFLRRFMPQMWALLGVYLLGSLPLYTMHGTNMYADAFLSAHIFAALMLLTLAFYESETKRRMSFLRLGAVATACLPFTKNEALFLYLPPILLFLIIGLTLTQRQNLKEKLVSGGIYAISTLIVLVPWLSFKWIHNLPFGNAKPISGLGISWHPEAVQAVFVNTFFEANWLLLFPLLLTLVVWQYKGLRTLPLLPIAAFFFIVWLGQMPLFFFTGLSVEAIRQTGYARGVIHLIPTAITLTTLLLYRAFARLEYDRNTKA